MKIRPFLGDLRGSFGGITASANKGGPYLKKRVNPVNPGTFRQQATRVIVGSLAVDWTLVLTQAQRDAWDVYAGTHTVKDKFGEDVFITGLAWYVKANARLVDAGEAAVATPPVTVAPAGLLAMTADIASGTTATITFTAALEAGHFVQLWVSLPVSVGSTPNRFQCRLSGYSTADEASPWTATLPHSFQVGNRGVFYAAVMAPNGLISAYLQAIDDADFV